MPVKLVIIRGGIAGILIDLTIEQMTAVTNIRRSDLVRLVGFKDDIDQIIYLAGQYPIHFGVYKDAFSAGKCRELSEGNAAFADALWAMGKDYPAPIMARYFSLQPGEQLQKRWKKR